MILPCGNLPHFWEILHKFVCIHKSRLMLMKSANNFVHFVPQKRRQLMYYTYAHEKCQYFCTLCTTKKKATYVLYICSWKVPIFLYARYVAQKRRQLMYYTLAHEKFQYFCMLCTTKKKATYVLYRRDACGRRPNVQYLRYWHLNLIKSIFKRR